MISSKTEFDHQASILCARMVSLDAPSRQAAAKEACQLLLSLPKDLSNSPHCKGEIAALKSLISRVENENVSVAPFRIFDEDFCECGCINAQNKEAALEAFFEKHHLHPQFKHSYHVFSHAESVEDFKARMLELAVGSPDQFIDEAGNEYDFR